MTVLPYKAHVPIRSDRCHCFSTCVHTPARKSCYTVPKPANPLQLHLQFHHHTTFTPKIHGVPAQACAVLQGTVSGLAAQPTYMHARMHVTPVAMRLEELEPASVPHCSHCDLLLTHNHQSHGMLTSCSPPKQLSWHPWLAQNNSVHLAQYIQAAHHQGALAFIGHASWSPVAGSFKPPQRSHNPSCRRCCLAMKTST